MSAAPVGSAPRALAPVARAARQRDLYDVVWELFTSVRIAIALVIVLAAAALVGTLLVQPVQTLDPRLITDPSLHARFLEFARERYGFLAGALAMPELRAWTVETMDALGLFDVFNAPFFRVALLVLAASVTMCTLNRLEPVWRTIARPLVRRDPRHYETARQRRVLPPYPVQRARAVLRARGYRLLETRDDAATVYILGDRNAWARFGTLASHLALLIILVSGAVGTLFGFRIDIAIADGSSLPVFPVGTTNNLTVRNERFVATFSADGLPTDFYSDLALVQNGREVARQRVRVNDPLRYGGLSFHQLSFGPTADVEVRDAKTGFVLLSEQVRFFEQLEGVPVDLRAIPGRNESLLLALPPRDPPILAVQVLQNEVPRGIVTVDRGKSVGVADYRVRFDGMSQYTVIRVARNAGEPLLWLASFLFLGGLLATFYWPRRRVWLRFRGSETVMTGTADRTFDMEGELDRLAEGLRAWRR